MGECFGQTESNRGDRIAAADHDRPRRRLEYPQLPRPAAVSWNDDKVSHEDYHKHRRDAVFSSESPSSGTACFKKSLNPL
jgi:hypothetical protein